MIMTLNSIVHIIMYGYYLLTTWDASYKQSIWWKKHVTQIQIVSLHDITYCSKIIVGASYVVAVGILSV